MKPGDGIYAFFLNAQGRILADAIVLCFDDHFLLDTEPELLEKVLQHIRRYIIADQVELEDATASTGCIGVEGPDAAAVMASLGAPVPEEAYSHVEWEGRTVAAVTASGQPGVRIFGNTTGLAARLEAAGAKRAEAADVRIVRIENGRPRYGDDIGETRLPQETQQMHAISFHKGCYIGQEIVERIRAQGHVNRKLMRIELDGSVAPSPGAKIAVNGNEAEVTSATVSPQSGKVIALAYVRVPRTQ